jgi:hypothetical protein
VFCGKRLQTIENKGNESRKEGKETTKRLQEHESNGFATEAQSWEGDWRLVPPHPRGIWMDVKIKGLREEGFVRA